LEPSGTNKTAKAPVHTLVTQPSKVWLFSRQAQRKHMWAVWRGLSNSLPFFMDHVPQTWQAYVLAGMAWHLANERRACGLSVR